MDTAEDRLFSQVEAGMGKGCSVAGLTESFFAGSSVSSAFSWAEPAIRFVSGQITEGSLDPDAFSLLLFGMHGFRFPFCPYYNRF